MVIDTSALLAVFFNEPHGPWVVDQLTASKTDLRMSVVNYAGSLILIRDRQAKLFEQLRDRILSSSIRLAPVSAEQGEVAADARLRYPLNLGDCFAYALAKSMGLRSSRLTAIFGALILLSCCRNSDGGTNATCASEDSKYESIEVVLKCLGRRVWSGDNWGGATSQSSAIHARTRNGDPD